MVTRNDLVYKKNNQLRIVNRWGKCARGGAESYTIQQAPSEYTVRKSDALTSREAHSSANSLSDALIKSESGSGCVDPRDGGCVCACVEVTRRSSLRRGASAHGRSPSKCDLRRGNVRHSDSVFCTHRWGRRLG